MIRKNVVHKIIALAVIAVDGQGAYVTEVIDQ